MEPIQRYQYKLALNLKVRSSYGTAFQDFFSLVMEKAHRTDFVRVRPFGSLGDKGCDGYRASNGQVFQCFGKLEDASLNVATLVKKVGDDYLLASGHLKSLMKEWHFAHNLVDGVPVELVTKIEALKAQHSHHGFGLISPAGLEERVFALEPFDLADLLGPAATAEDSANLRMDEVRDLVTAVMDAIDTVDIDPGDVRPVPFDKLEFNKLPAHWVQLISAASKNGPHVRRYFDSHPHAEAGKVVAAAFAHRYAALKLDGLGPGAVMDALYEQVTGVGSVPAARQVAAQALLAYLFDACDIFEDHPAKVVA